MVRARVYRIITTAAMLITVAALLAACAADTGGGLPEDLTWQEVRDYLAQEANIKVKLDASKSDEYGWKLHGKDFNLWLFAAGEFPTDWTIGDQDIAEAGKQTVRWVPYEEFSGGYFSVLRSYRKGLVLDYYTEDAARTDKPPVPKWLPFVHKVLTELTSS